MRKKSAFDSQRGITLVIGLIMLALITIVAMMAFNLSQGNLKIVNNAQHREEASKSAQQAIDEVLSKPDFITDKTQPVPADKRCDGVATKYCTDVNSDGDRDYAVTVTATCVKARAIYIKELDINNQDDVRCLIQDIAPLPGGQSLCAETVWDIGADAQDQASAAKVTMHQGAAVRVSIDNADTACK
jgi:type II secretory pathway pseudopilin PulG